jgi:hypothetical protein
MRPNYGIPIDTPKGVVFSGNMGDYTFSVKPGLRVDEVNLSYKLDSVSQYDVRVYDIGAYTPPSGTATYQIG